jgi:fumarate reductase flavoprotein subunit
MNARQIPSTETVKTDIVIIGGGGAGLAAAVEAAEKGVNIVLLEKRHAPAGNSQFAWGLFAAESPAQKRMAIDSPRDELFKMAMDYARWRIDPNIVRTLVDKSGDTVRWLEEMGVKFDWILPLYPNQAPLVFHYSKGGSGTAVIKALVKKCEDLGVPLLCQTAAKRIFTSEKGSVTGVLAATKGKELRIIAKSVIIATGGYAGNKEMLKKYYPTYSENMYCAGLSHKGDGLRMATEIGAATEGLGILELCGQLFPWSSYLSALAEEPNMIWVNKKGERFIDEGITFRFPERANAVDRQPDKICYTIFDETIKQKVIEDGFIQTVMRGVQSIEGIQGLPSEMAARKKKTIGLEKELQLQADKGRVKISNSWDELAAWIGVVPEVLKATIEEYNSFCDRGYDENFLKDRRYLVPLRIPPYYAIKCYSAFYNTLGGIKINHHMEVLNHQDSPIPGLYAAGVDTGGWEWDTYNITLAGHSFGFAVNSGRVAGENAAKYVLGK